MNKNIAAYGSKRALREIAVKIGETLKQKGSTVDVLGRTVKDLTPYNKIISAVRFILTLA